MDGQAHWITLAEVLGGGLVILLVESLFASVRRA